MVHYEPYFINSQQIFEVNEIFFRSRFTASTQSKRCRRRRGQMDLKRSKDVSIWKTSNFQPNVMDSFSFPPSFGNLRPVLPAET